MIRLEAAVEKEAEAAAALEEVGKRQRALTADRNKMKDFEELEAQHVQVGCKLSKCSPGWSHLCATLQYQPGSVRSNPEYDLACNGFLANSTLPEVTLQPSESSNI